MANYTSSGVDYSGFYSDGTPKDTVPGGAFNVNDPYANLEPNQGGATNLVRVTPEGLNVRGVTSVQIAPDGTPIPNAAPKQSAIVRALLASGSAGGPVGINGNALPMRTIPGPNGTIIAKDQTRLPGQIAAQFDPVEAYSGVPRNPGQQAIEAFAPRSAAFSPWGPDWTTGIGAVHQPMLLGSPGKFAGSDPWAADRFGGETVAPRPGMVTGAAPSVSPVAAALVAANARPITYSAPVAAGNFAQGSPNQSFEKQNGMGSVTNSMASSSRWNTGY